MTDKIHNIVDLKINRKNLRNSLTPAEAKLWPLLKGSQLDGRKFRRQHSVGPYVLDFYCPSEKLCIELDGAAHFTHQGAEYDTARTEYLEALNIRVVRFENRDVFENTEGVLQAIRGNFNNTQPTRLSEGRQTTPAFRHPSLAKEGS